MYQPKFKFDGSDYNPVFDKVRLTKHLRCIWILMSDNRWRTLLEIEAVTGYPQASISAHLRDFRKKRYGAHTVEKRSRGERSAGLYEYKVIKNPNTQIEIG